MGGLSRTVLAVAVLLGATGCAVREVSDPFGVTRAEGDGPKMSVHFVRFEARCDGCTLNWRVHDQLGADSDSGIYSHRVTVHLRPGETAHAHLTATPRTRDGVVRYVRIFVDGELAGESEHEGTDEQVVIETVRGPLSTAAVVSGSNHRVVGTTVPSER